MERAERSPLPAYALRRTCSTLVGLLLLAFGVRANHYLGGSISYACQGGNNYLITLDLFLDCSGTAIVPQSLSVVSDCGTSYVINSLSPGTGTEVSQLCPASLSNSTCNGGALPGVMHYQIQQLLNLPPCNHWTFSWNICCRGAAVDLAGTQGIYIESTLNNTGGLCDNSPVFTDQSLPYVCVNQQVNYNFGIVDPDGDQLVYSLVNAQFYTGTTAMDVTYNAPTYTGASPVPGIVLDQSSGQLTFTPTISGRYVIVMQVDSYDASGNYIGSVMRDVVFVVIPCTGNAPVAAATPTITSGANAVLTGQYAIEVCNGSPFCFDMPFSDADAATTLQIASQVTSLLPGSTFSVIGTNPAVAHICWTGDVNNSPVNVLLEANDGACPVVNTASVGINITTVTGGGGPPDPGTNGTVSLCSTAAPVSLFAQLGGTPDPGGTWIGPDGVPHDDQFVPATDAGGVYTYRAGNACSYATSTVTVSLTPPPSAGTNGTLTICSNAAAVSLISRLGGTPTAGGAWTGPSTVVGGNYDPATMNPGVYTYTVTSNCAPVSATVTVTERAAANAGTNGTLTVCSNGATVSLFAQLGGGPTAGGTWTGPSTVTAGNYNPVTMNPGVYTYTVTGTAPCPNATATVTVTENAPPNAGTNGTLTICSTGAAVSLFSRLGGAPAAGGAWTGPSTVVGGNYDPATMNPGVYTYTVTGTAPCANATATVTVTENTAADAGTNGTLTVCSNGAAVSLFTQLGGSPQAGGAWTGPSAVVGGNYNPVTMNPGVYTYTVTGTAPCANATATVTVTENAPPNAGTNGTLTVCGNGAAVSLFAQLGGGPAAGGSWTGPSTVTGGNYDPPTMTAGVYTYTVTGTAPCANATATVTVTENAPPNAGTNGTLTVCSNGAAVSLFNQLGGGPAAGGSWTGPSAVVGGNYDPPTMTAGVYTYTVTGTAPCANATATVTVTENAPPNAGTNGTLTVCGDGASTSLLAQLGGGPAAGGSWTGPSAVVGGNYDPPTMTPGVYTYTVTGTAPCANATATVTVTENAPPNAGTNGTLTVCSNGAAVSLFNQLGGGPAAGGSWTGPSAVVGGNYDPPTMTPGVYTYTVTGTAPCANATATVTVTENAPPNAGTNGTLTVCGDGASTSLFAQLGGGPAAGGSWTGPSAVVGGNYDPPTMNPGVYTYTVTGTAPCANATATVTVTENAPPNAGTNGTLTVCSNGAAVSLFNQLGGGPAAGGSWTGPSAVVGGNYDPPAMNPGVYTYTVTGTAPCANATATVTVTENAPPNAGTNGTLTVCGNGVAVSLFAQLGGGPAAGGSWTGPSAVVGGNYDPPTMNPGVYTYTVTGTAPCANATATVTVTENAPVQAGADASTTLCSTSAATNLFTLLTGAQVGGTWTTSANAPFSGTYDPATNASDVFTYTVTGTAPCANDQATVTVTENAAANAGADAALTVCDDSAPTALFPLLTGAQAGGSWSGPSSVVGGMYDPATMNAGAYTYTVNGVAPCANDQATVTVTEHAAPHAGTDGALSLCSNGAAVNLFGSLTGADAGGTWTTSANAPFSGTYDPATDASDVFTYTVAGIAPCANDQATVTVTENAAPNAGTNGTLTVCNTGAAVSLFAQLGGSPQAGGAWSGPSAVVGGMYDPATMNAGVYTYTVTGSAPCANATATVTVTENAAPNAGADGALAICSNGTPTNLFPLLTGAQSGGSWVDGSNAAFSGTYDPAVNASGTFTYTVSGVAPCANDQATVTVTENAAPNAGADAVLSTCSSSAATNLFPLLTGAQAGGTWTNGVAPFSGTYDPAVNASGVYTYTVTGTAPCANDQATVTVTENAAANAGTNGTLSICSDQAAVSLFAQLGGSPQAGGTWSGPSAVVGGMYDPGTMVQGVYTYTVTAVAPCVNATATVTVTERTAPQAGADGTLAVCDQGAAVSLAGALSGADPGGAWNGPSPVVGGNYDPATMTPGAYTYTVSGTAPCAADQATVTVTETSTPHAGADGSITLCKNEAPVDLFTVLVGADGGGSWTGPSGAGHSAIVDPGTDLAGVYTYTITAVPPCAGDQSTVTVTLNTPPQAGLDGAITVCDQGGAVSLASALTGADAGGSWTGPSAVVGGNYDPPTMNPGVYTYTVTGIAPCANDQSTVTVTETSTPHAGTDGSITLCSNNAPVDLAGSITGEDAGGTWTDPSGAAHGNMLDPSTDVSGVYHYTIAAVPPCAGDVSQVTVTINAAPHAGTDGALTVCDLGGAVALINSLSGADAGGSWSGPSAVVGGNYDPATMTPGAYTYTVSGTAPCASDQAVVTVTETSAPNAGTDGSANVCASGVPVSLFSLINGEDPGGFWTDPSGGLHSPTFTPGGDGAGTYTYNISGVAPCPGDQATVNITVTPAPSAGIDGTLTICDQAAPVALIASLTGGPNAGGTWSGPSAVVGGNYDPATMSPGVYTYTVIGAVPCANDQSTVTVTETSTPNAGTDGSITLCANSATVDLGTLITGEDAGGTWTDPSGAAHGNTLDPSTDAGGVYHYTIAAVPPCAGDVSQVTVTINAAPNAGTDGSLTVCDQGAAVALINSLGGSPNVGGTWSGPSAVVGGNYDPATMSPGVYTYTVIGAVPCANDQSTVTVTETSTPNAGTDGSITLCANSASVDLGTLITGEDAGGTWTDPSGAAHGNTLDPATDAGGVYHYTIAAVPPCAGDVSQVTVTINAAPNAGTDGSLTVCDQGAAVALINSLGGSPNVGGTWSGPSAVVGGNYDPATMNAGVYTYTVTGSAPCANDQSTVTVTETSTPNAGTDGSITLCANSASVDLGTLITGEDAGGTWTDPSGAAHGNILDPATDAGGVYHYTITAVPPCAGDVSQVTVTINAAPNAGMDGSLTVCDQGAAVALINSLGGNPNVGGTWSGPSAVVGGNYDPATMNAGVYTYTVTGSAPCANDQSTVTVTETSTPNAGTDGSITLCANGVPADLFAQLTGADAGGTWTAPDGSLHSATLDPTVDASGVYRYTIAAVPPCAGDQAQVTVTINAAPNAGTDGTLSVCDQGGAVALINSLGGADAGGTWSGPSAVVGGNYDPATMDPGAYVYTVSGIAPCGSDQSTVTVSETSSPEAGGDGSITVCESGTPFSLFAQLSNADAGGTWTDPDGNAHSATFTPGTDAGGVYTYSIAAVPPCSGDAATVTVTVEQQASAGTNGSVAVCTGDAPFDLITVLGASPDAGGAWTNAGGSAVNSTFDPAASAAGIYTYTITSAVCAQVSATATVSISPGPNAGQDNSVAYCDQGPAVDLFDELNGTPDAGGTWTGPDGLPTSSTFDPTASAPGDYTYLVPSSSTCPDASATVTITVNSPPSAGTIGIATLCSDGDPVDLFDALGGSPDAGGTWAGPDGNATTGTFDPATSAPGVYTYTVAGTPPCPSASASITVEVQHAPDAGTDAHAAYCASDAVVNLIGLLGGSPDGGGTWSGPGGAVPSGQFDPASSAAGVYTYTLDATPPCVSDAATVTIDVAQPVDAGHDGAITLCSDHAPVALFPLLQGTPNSGGAWTAPDGTAMDGTLDPSMLISGDYFYTVTAVAPCPQDQSRVHVDILPAPQAVITAEVGDGCSPVQVTFSSTYSGGGSCHWDFGNGGTSNDCAPPPVIYDTTGTFNVTLTIDPGNGCITTFEQDGGVEVHGMPEAAFSALDDHLNAATPLVGFVNQSTDATTFAWDFSGLGTSTEVHPTFIFPHDQEAVYSICLIAYASPTCADTVCHDLYIPLAASVNVPNAFTPDGDGHNDRFSPVMDGVDPAEYQFYIFDRWGQLIYSTQKLEDQWDGTFNGTPAQVDVYVWKVVGKDGRTNDRFERVGHVSLVR